jgi:deoxyribodipyrimidine photolyase
MHIFWHQRDLRIPDNRGLAAAAADDTTLPVYVVDSDLLKQIGTRQRAFLLEGVRALRERYRDLGSDLVVRTGAPADVLADLREATDADRVYYNTHYRPARRNRQRRVDDAVPTESVTDLVLVNPARLDPEYPNHSRFYDDWQAESKLPPASTPTPTPSHRSPPTPPAASPRSTPTSTSRQRGTAPPASGTTAFSTPESRRTTTPATICGSRSSGRSARSRGSRRTSRRG